jgi:hypothetical protein
MYQTPPGLFQLGIYDNNVVSDQINSNQDCLQANHMSSSLKTDNLICSF